MKNTFYSYLRYFLIVAEEENVTRAAKRLYISQPALSATIARLEKALGFDLFTRKNNRIVLNEAGRCFLQYVNSAFSIIDEGHNKARDIALHDANTVRIFSSMGILRYFCDEYQVQHPDCSIELKVCDTETLVSAIISGSADFGINFGVIQDSRVTNRVIMEGPYCVAVNGEHPLYARRMIDIHALSEYQLFCSNLGNTNEKIQSLFAKERCSCKLLCLDERDVLFKAARFGLGGVVCLPMHAHAREGNDVIDFVPIGGCAQNACVSLVSNSKSTYYTKRIEKVIEHVIRKFQENERALLKDLSRRGYSFRAEYHQSL